MTRNLIDYSEKKRSIPDEDVATRGVKYCRRGAATLYRNYRSPRAPSPLELSDAQRTCRSEHDRGEVPLILRVGLTNHASYFPLGARKTISSSAK